MNAWACSCEPVKCQLHNPRTSKLWTGRDACNLCERMYLWQGDEWEERWGEHYLSKGKARKWADKWGKEGANIWHERWGENYPEANSCVKYTDKVGIGPPPISPSATHTSAVAQTVQMLLTPQNLSHPGTFHTPHHPTHSYGLHTAGYSQNRKSFFGMSETLQF